MAKNLIESQDIQIIESGTNDLELSFKEGNTIDNKIGDMAELITPEVSTLVEAINSIVESGTNANGSYIKYANGTMICYGLHAANYTIDIAYGNVFRGDSKTITLPNEFIDTNYRVYFNGHAPVNSAYSNDTKTTTTCGFFPISYTSRTGGNKSVNFLTIGRWK